ncbi:U3 small nucleolar RNA-associated protein 18 homolog isoform X1 [Strongylocentrotus purpuratus]|uniref:U3 small nucleolar RNA-associated protein 18 homolog n=1 Tax=Strongylocentrotus purpuratus TaxID=7668 RepID=A0A7M7NLF9_STRPU|nr:U3 small nucleolar RNA-associated protein 18 homolog isoform X1 [Strongylocentrotus purpuratus]
MQGEARKRRVQSTTTSKSKHIKTNDGETEATHHVLGSKMKSRRKESSEILLENLVFGNDIEDPIFESEEEEAVELDPHSGSEEDPAKDDDVSTEIQSRLQATESSLDKGKKKPAWHDDTDEVQLSFDQEKTFRQQKIQRRAEKEVSGHQLQERLKSQYEKVVGSTPSWAKLKSEREKDAGSDESEDDEEDDDHPLLRRTGDYLTTSEMLPSVNLNIKRLTNLNKEQPTEGMVTALEFHPGAQVAMVAGLDQRLNLFQVEGRHNPKIQSVFVEQFPIHCAHFASQGTEVVLSGKRKFFYIYDMIAGKVSQIPYIRGIQENKLMSFEVSPDGKFLAFLGDYGNIHLLSAQTKELITTLKMNGTVDAVTFTPDGSKMMSFGDDCDVYVWDMNTRDCVHKFADDGCIKGNTISVSQGNRYVATGSQSGVINIYDDQCLTKVHPTPLKAVMNMTTPVTATRFNSNNEILAAISVYSRDVVKLIHLPSCHTFANFPSSNEVLRSPCALEFSPRSGYFALGNNKGEVPLFRLKHYKDY